MAKVEDKVTDKIEKAIAKHPDIVGYIMCFLGIVAIILVIWYFWKKSKETKK